MEQKYLILRAQLQDLGYNQQLPLDSIPLVEKLLGDLIKTTESLQKYMKLTQDIVTERDSLLLGAEPYKCDNAKLVRECNELHLAFLQYREQNEKLQKDLKKRIYELEQEKTDYEKKNEALKRQLRELEIEGLTRSNKQIRSSTAKTGGKPLKSSSTSALLKDKCTPRETSSAMSLAENRITNLSKEISRLKEEKLELAQANASYKTQINSRDKEIQRLTQMLHGGRPLEALNQDCCYKDVEVNLVKLQDEVLNLKVTNADLEKRLKDAIAKQHEAMKRALTLAERNKVLEKELKDIDQMALAVEQECNSTVKNNTDKVNRLQNRLHEAILQIQQLEKETIELKRDKHELLSDCEAVKTEKRHLQGMLETALEEKKRVTSRVTQCGIIENDLNLEIDRLVQLNAEQKHKIAELECKLLSGRFDKGPLKTIDELRSSSMNASKGKRSSPPSKFKGKSSVNRKFRMSSGGDNIVISAKDIDSTNPLLDKRNVEDAATSPIANLCPQPDQCIKRIEELITKEIREKNVCFDHLKEVIGQEISDLHTKALASLEQFKEEKDFYKNECDTLMDKLKAMCDKTGNFDLQQKLNQKEKELSKFQHELKCLNLEKQNLLIRLDSARSQSDDHDALSFRSVTKRLERERDILKADILHLEEERDGLRRRINILCEDYNQEKCRLENMLKDRERELYKMEQDHKEIMHTQGTRRATINNLQEECEMLSTQLKSCQAELTQQRAMYAQLKMLHEQTDRALADCQSQLIHAEKEMCALQEKVKKLELEKEDSNKDVVNLKNDLQVTKNNLMTFDREKDALVQMLDEKTEKLVSFQQELKAKDKKVVALEANIADLRKRISDNLSERSSKDHQLRTITGDVQKLQHDLESAVRARELAFDENRRLQDNLASCVRDNKKVQNDLDIAKRQVDDLKRQLQHYVAEVKRAEDLISQKEVERSEMLDHFKSLSEEATNLESTNHTLENEATQAKVQLSVALDHAADLERKVEVQDTMIRDYEKQIASLTAQIARLESIIEQGNSDKGRVEVELSSMRDLCLKLDKQKDNLMKQLNEKDSAKIEANRENSDLRRNSQTLQTELDKERNTVQSLEKHLAHCRQETIDMRLLNEELRNDVEKLKITIQELQSKLKYCLCSTLQAKSIFVDKGPTQPIILSSGKNELKDKVHSIVQKYSILRQPDDQAQNNDSKIHSTTLTEMSSEQELAHKYLQYTSASVPEKTTSNSLHKKISFVAHKKTNTNDQFVVPVVDSVSQANIDQEFDEELSKTVKYPSAINIASPSNASKCEKLLQTEKSNHRRSVNNLVNEIAYASVSPSCPVVINTVTNEPTIVNERFDQDKVNSKIPVLEKRTKSKGSYNTRDYQSLTCTCNSLRPSNFQTTYTYSYKPGTQYGQEDTK